MLRRGYLFDYFFLFGHGLQLDFAHQFFAVEEVDDVFRSHRADRRFTFIGLDGKMRCQDNALMLKERTLGIARFRLGNVEACTEDLVLVQGTNKRFFIHDGTTCAVQQHCGFLHDVKFMVANHVARFVRQH